MLHWSKPAGLAFIAACCLGAPASAQDADGWDVFEDAANDRLIASVEYGSGTGLVIQCQAGVFTVAVLGTPLTGSSFRATVFDAEDGRSREAYWRSSPEMSAAVVASPRVARFLRKGGKVTLRTRSGDTEPFRVVFDLPSDGEGVDQVLTRCGQPLTHDRDENPDLGDLITTRPVLEMPSSVMPDRGEQSVAIQCLIRASRLAECRSESQNPPNPRAGEVTARAANGTRVGVSDVAAAEGRLIEIIVTGYRVRR